MFVQLNQKEMSALLLDKKINEDFNPRSQNATFPLSSFYCTNSPSEKTATFLLFGKWNSAGINQILPVCRAEEAAWF